MTKEQLEQFKISNLEISNRCLNALKRQKYVVLGDLVGESPDKIKNIRNIGEKTFNELDQKLKSLSFKVNEKGVYEIDTDKLIQENLKDLTDETYIEKFAGILCELVSNTQEIENIDRQILALQQQKVGLETANANLVKNITNIYEILEENTKKDKKIIEDSKTKKYIIK